MRWAPGASFRQPRIDGCGLVAGRELCAWCQDAAETMDFCSKSWQMACDPYLGVDRAGSRGKCLLYAQVRGRAWPLRSGRTKSSPAVLGALGLALRSSFISFGSFGSVLELASIITVSAGVSACSAAFRFS